MAHGLPTPTQTPPVPGDLDETILERVERWRVPLLVGLAVVVFGGIGITVWSVVRRDRIHTLHAELHGITDGFDGQTLFLQAGGEYGIPNGTAAVAQAEKLIALREKARGTEVEPLVLFHIAQRWQVAEQDAKCLAALEELTTGFPDAEILRVPSFDSEKASVVSRMQAASRRRGEWAASHKYEAPKADPSTVALVEYAGGAGTGQFKIAFYPDRAPLHVQAFVAQAKAGGFNGTRMYTARPGDFLQFGGGDRTRNDLPHDDGEDDPAVSLPPEDAATFGIRHVRGTVTSVKMLSGDQGDRFSVILGAAKKEFDSTRTPFGEILDAAGLAACDTLGSVTTYSKDVMHQGKREERSYPDTPSPAHRVILRRVSIWRNGEIDAGHTWDTSRVGTDADEPAPAPPK
jgi:cyclophilin family peptidyl-prolyl cis-trans isomerase